MLYKINIIIIFIIFCKIQDVFNSNICELKTSNDQLIEANLFTKNTIPQDGNYYSIENATTWSDCVIKCCSNKKCNLAYFKLNRICYLIQCVTNNLCEPIPNIFKDPLTPEDYVIKIRNFGDTTSYVSKEKNEIEKYKKIHKCNPKNSKSCSINEMCTFNEITKEYECICKSNKYKRINDKCYEYLSKTQPCELNFNKCIKPNEICLTLTERSTDGTCQCKFLYERDSNGNCILQSEAFERKINEDKTNEKNDNLNYEYLDLDYTEKTKTTKENEAYSNKDLITIDSSTQNPEMTTKIAAKTNEFDESKIKAEKLINNLYLISNAGANQYIYFPTTICILDGSNSTNLEGSPIVKWEWSKSQSSPSIGDFAVTNGISTSSNKVAVIENLVEGDYTFILKIWANNVSNEYSQSTTQVFVRYNSKNNNDNIEIINNRLKLDLNVNPLNFDEIEKNDLITKIETIISKQLISMKPRIMVIRQNIIKLFAKSSISIEFFVIDDFNNKVIDSSLIMKLLYDQLVTTNLFLNFNIMSNDNNNLHNQYIYDLQQMKCLHNCSNHGICDSITFKCVCDRYWIFNLYKYYLLDNIDETYGNNCEWNVIYISLSLLFTFIISFILICSCVRCFCCRCCFRKNKNDRRYELNDERIERRNKRSLCWKLFCCLCNKRRNNSDDFDDTHSINKKKKEIKYSLLENKDDSFQFTVGGKKAKEERTYGLNSSDDEYETKNLTSKSRKMNWKNIKKEFYDEDEEDEEDILYDTNNRLIKKNYTNKFNKKDTDIA